MLRTRVITAVVLLAALLFILWSGSALLLAVALTAFVAAATWESQRLSGAAHPQIAAALWSLLLLVLLLWARPEGAWLLAALCSALWAVRFAPALGLGLPPLHSTASRLLGSLYGVAIVGCFLSMALLLRHSVPYLLSVLALVWVADIGAYFSGKAFGRRKLAPSISPGKSWEGAIGGWLAVLVLGAACAAIPALADTFPAHVARAWGWLALFAILTLITAASVAGDLFESLLKRRAGMKDSSNLLPGHGGVLDRVDALIPVLPLAVLFDAWL